jgi:predicted RNase H-like HicB family nuclease
MQKLKYIHWQDGEMFLGYLEEYPDYWTQAESLEELRENFAELFRDRSKLGSSSGPE